MIINLICGPRNVSTALMYSFAQREDTTVIDEPFYAYYLKKTGIIHPGRREIMQSMKQDIGLVTDSLLNRDSDEHILFLKNMAHHHIDVDDAFLKQAKNVFLIRNPAELIVSFSKVIPQPTIDDIGLKKSAELYQHLRKSGQSPVVIDSGELLKDPIVMLPRICGEIGIDYNVKMQSWTPGPRKEDGVWAKYWYGNLHKTTGFNKSKPHKVHVPEHLKPLLDEAKPYYHELFNVSVKY